MTDHLLRGHAPISDRAWELIGEEARLSLAPALAARRLVDFSGPRGWQYSAANLGRAEPVTAPVDGVSALRRRTLPLVELRAPFTVSRAELADVDRGAEDPDLDELGEAARRLALGENVSVLRDGVAAASPHPPIALEDDMTACPRHVAQAVELLREHGIGGPYGLALGPDIHRRVVETTEHGGYPLFEHLRHILGGPMVWAPGLDGGVALSLRGGDFLLDCGQDIAIAYERHDAEQLQLCLVESFAFRVATPEAAVALRPNSGLTSTTPRPTSS
jgi:uncharacterized linocin/CFP29 family protein